MGKKVVCITGGGVRGNYALGCIIKLQALKSDLVSDPDIIGGVSAGALVGVSLATRKNLGDMYTDMAHATLTPRMGPCSVASKAMHLYTGSSAFLYPNTHLRDFINTHFKNTKVQKHLNVYTCNAGTLKSQVFSHKPGTVAHTDALLASCSIPGVFPAVGIGGSQYIDGGAISNYPLQDIICGLEDPTISHISLFNSHPWDMRNVPVSANVALSSTRSLLGRLAIEYSHASAYVDDRRALDIMQVREAPDGPFVARYKRHGSKTKLIDVVTTTSEPTHLVDFDVAVACYAPTVQQYAQAEQVNLTTPVKLRLAVTNALLEHGKTGGALLNHIAIKAGMISPARLII